MKLYVMRHGPAEARRAGLADEERSLTEEGAEEVSRAAAGLARLKVSPQKVFTSPVRRAFQTAEIVAAQLNLVGRMEVLDALTAGSAPDAILQSLAREAEDVLIIGHNPDFAEFVSLCLTGSGAVAVDLGTASVLCLDFASSPRRGEGVLRWYLRRGQLAQLAS